MRVESYPKVTCDISLFGVLLLYLKLEYDIPFLYFAS